MFIKKLSYMKSEARKMGYISNPKHGFKKFKDFYDSHRLYEESCSGQVIEIILCFILGMMQAYQHENRRNFYIDVSPELDRRGIDIAINHICFQLKFDWNPLKMIIEKDELKRINIHLIVIPSSLEPSSDIIDQLIEMLELVGFSAEEIQDEIDNDPSLDAAVEIWDWYCRGIK